MGGGPLPSDAGRAERMYKVRRAMGHMFFQAATLTGAGTGDAELFHVVCGGDPARTAVWLTSSLSAGAVIEVFLFQIVGRATDHTGRKKPWLFLSPGMSFVTGLAPFLCPRLPVVQGPQGHGTHVLSGSDADWRWHGRRRAVPRRLWWRPCADGRLAHLLTVGRRGHRGLPLPNRWTGDRSHRTEETVAVPLSGIERLCRNPNAAKTDRPRWA